MPCRRKKLQAPRELSAPATQTDIHLNEEALQSQKEAGLVTKEESNKPLVKSPGKKTKQTRGPQHGGKMCRNKNPTGLEAEKPEQP